jgi:hypothetical protein
MKPLAKNPELIALRRAAHEAEPAEERFSIRP